MAIFDESKITKLGHELVNKVLSGKCELHFAEVWAGDGHLTGDVWDLTDLVGPRLEGRILSFKPMGLFTELEILITNKNLTSVLEFREVGVKAIDPDIGLILFSYANAGDNVDYIGPFNGIFLTEEQFTMKTYTANVANITATIEESSHAYQISYDNTSSGLDATNLQDAVDEMKLLLSNYYTKLQIDAMLSDILLPQATTERIASITHSLKFTPKGVLYATEYAAGVGGAGETPAGGEKSVEVPCRLELTDYNIIEVYTIKEYAGRPEVNRINEQEYALVYPDKTSGLYLSLR